MIDQAVGLHVVIKDSTSIVMQALPGRRRWPGKCFRVNNGRRSCLSWHLFRRSSRPAAGRIFAANQVGCDCRSYASLKARTSIAKLASSRQRAQSWSVLVAPTVAVEKKERKRERQL